MPGHPCPPLPGPWAPGSAGPPRRQWNSAEGLQQREKWPVNTRGSGRGPWDGNEKRNDLYLCILSAWKPRLRWKCLHSGLCTFPFSGSRAWDTAKVQQRWTGWMTQCPLNLRTVLDPFSTYQSCHLIWNLTLQCGFTRCLASRLCPYGFCFSNLVLHQGFLAPCRLSFSHSYLCSSLQSQGLCTCCSLSGTHMAWLTWAHPSDPSSLYYESPLDFLTTSELHS